VAIEPELIFLPNAPVPSVLSLVSFGFFGL